MGIGSHTKPVRGRSDDWCTPPDILAALGPFDDDPCPIGGKGGLTREWQGRAFVNPPYGPATWAWMRKLADHGNGIALIFARTETAGFFETVWERADAALFIKGRLYFLRPNGAREGNAGGPSVLVAYGESNVQALKTCGVPGQFVRWR